MEDKDCCRKIDRQEDDRVEDNEWKKRGRIVRANLNRTKKKKKRKKKGKARIEEDGVGKK